MKTYQGNPILQIKEKVSEGNLVPFGLYRDRFPDNGWGELSWINLSAANHKEEDSQELKIKLLEDLAYAFGTDTVEFNRQLIEHNLI